MDNFDDAPLEGELTPPPASSPQQARSLAVSEDAKTALTLALAKQEIDTQITTAKLYSRSVDGAMKRIYEMATLDPETAKECIYALKRGNRILNGPSIRFAEIVASSWGNARTMSRVINVDKYEGYVEAEAVYVDLETNYATKETSRRRIKDRYGRLYADDMILVTGQAACKIALRNAILAGVFKGAWRGAYLAATKVVAGDVASLSKRRADAVDTFAKMGVTPEQIFEALDVEGVEDIGLNEVATLTALYRQIRDKETSIDEAFPPKRKPGAKPKGTDAKVDELLKKGRPAHDPDTGEVNQSDQQPQSSDQGSPTDSLDRKNASSDETSTRSGAESSSQVSGDDSAASTTAEAGAASKPAGGAKPKAEPKPEAKPTPKPEPKPETQTAAGPKAGVDAERDAATLVDLRAEAENRAAQGSEALKEFEDDLTEYESDLIAPFIGGLRRKAKAAGSPKGGDR